MDLIEAAKKKALDGITLNREEIISLLDISIDSIEDHALRKAAMEVAKVKTKMNGYIWSAVGADYAPCPMNCKFCSFGEKWNIIKKPVHYTKKEIVEKAKEFIKEGARFIVLRTTEFYSIQKLMKIAKRIRKEMPGNYEIELNTGELDMTIAGLIKESGINGIYHAHRLREGIDTPFEVSLRDNTMNNVLRSSLDLTSLVEPIGYEHTNEEIADNFLNILKYKAIISGAMARIPVPGTPFENEERISDSKLAHIIAVLRLAGGDIVKDICVHPASLEALKSGANVMVVETGAIPRDTDCESDNWHGTDIAKAKQMLIEAGYTVKNEK